MKNKNFAYALLGLNVISAWASWWTLGNSISGRIDQFDWLIPTIAFSLWAIVFTLGAIFIRNKYLFYGSLVVGGVGYVFLNSFNPSMIAVALALAILVATEYGVKKELEKGIRINFYYVVRQSLKFFVTAVCIVVAFSYYFSLDKEDAAMSIIERDSLAQEVDWGLKTAGYFVPENQKESIEKIQNGVTIDEYLSENQSNSEFNIQQLAEIDESSQEQANHVDINSVSQSLSQRIRQESITRSKEKLSENLGLPISGEEPVKDIIVRYIDKTQSDFFERSAGIQAHLPIIMALALFLTARILATIVDIFLGFVILVLIRLFRNFGVINIKREMREAAVIEHSV